MKLSKAVITSLDLETTGLFPGPGGDRICEIGAVKVTPEGKRSVFDELIAPGRPISKAAYRINRITPEMLAGKPGISEILPCFIKFIENTVLMAYNAPFDIGFLAAALKNDNIILKNMYVIDMLKIARKCFSIPGRRYTLSNVADFLGIERKNEHRALSDAKTALEVFDKAYPLLKQKKIDNVEDIAVPCGEIINKDLHRNKPFLDILHKAMREQRPVFIHYRSKWSDNSTKRAITPISINGKYLHSYCHLRGEKRTFLIECIENAADIKK